MVLFQKLGGEKHPHSRRHTLYFRLRQVKKYNDKKGGGVLNIPPPHRVHISLLKYSLWFVGCVWQGGVEGLIHAFKYQRATRPTSAVREREWKLDSLSLNWQCDSKRFSLKTPGYLNLQPSPPSPWLASGNVWRKAWPSACVLSLVIALFLSCPSFWGAVTSRKV